MLLWNGRHHSCLLGLNAGRRHLFIELCWACCVNSCLNNFRWIMRKKGKGKRSQCIFPFPKRTLPQGFLSLNATNVLDWIILCCWGRRGSSCALSDIYQHLWHPHPPPFLFRCDDQECLQTLTNVSRNWQISPVGAKITPDTVLP